MILPMQLITIVLEITIVSVYSIVLTVPFSPWFVFTLHLNWVIDTNPESHFSQMIGAVLFVLSSARLGLL